MMEIVLKNIQAIKYGKYEFPDTGFVKITGGNSNGKSILIKTIGAITSMNITDAECRKALIRRGETEAYVIMTYRNKGLCVKLAKERNECLVSLTREDGEVVTRTFRDGGIEALIDEFGFKCYNKNSVCLQIYETFGPMPFVNTSPAINGEIVEDYTEDAVAKSFLTAFQEHTYKRAKETLKVFEEKKTSWENVRRNLVFYDYNKYEELATRMDYLFKQLGFLGVMDFEELSIPPAIDFIDIEPINLEELKIPPTVNLIDIEAPKLSELKFIEVMPHIEMMRELTAEIDELLNVLNGVCPTCGKPLYA